MITLEDVRNLRVKKADDLSSLSGFLPPAKTIFDLIAAIRADHGLTFSQQQELIEQIRDLVGPVPDSTPLSALMYKGLGGTIGYLISKYFKMGVVGQVISALAGFGLGSAIYNKINTPPDPYKGYKILR